MKESIFELAEKLVERGYKFRVSLESKSLMVNRKYLIKDGVWNKSRPLQRIEPIDEDAMWKLLDGLYEEYYHSRPSERSSSAKKSYFKALKESQLEDEDMMYAPVRDLAQLRLELTILCMVIAGRLVWDEKKYGKWFWQSKNNKNFVILRKWIDNQ